MKITIKDPGSALTHYIGMLLAIFAAIPLFYRIAQHPSPKKLVSFGIFALSVVLLYAASTLYHTLDISPKVNKILRKIDHMMIFFMIAGSYTPVCAIVLGNRTGYLMLFAVWAVALLGVLLNLFWINCPKWLSSLIYIAMGWICIFAIVTIRHALSPLAFGFLFWGGVIYTAGGVIYALKLPIFSKLPRWFGNHEIFHCFVMAGSACHYFMMLLIA